MPINTIKVYCNLALILYTKGSVLKVVIAISVISTAIHEYLQALLASFIFITVALSNIKFLKAVK